MTTASEAQFAGNRLIDAMTVADLNALRTLTPEQLERQAAARGELVHYLTVVWEQANNAARTPPTIRSISASAARATS